MATGQIYPNRYNNHRLLSNEVIYMLYSYICRISQVPLVSIGPHTVYVYSLCLWLAEGGVGCTRQHKDVMCVCVCEGYTAVLGGQVFSCFCFLGADTGVNIQKMMSQPQQRARRPVQSQAQFPQRLSNIKTICCPTVRPCGRVSTGWGVRLAPGHSAIKLPQQESYRSGWAWNTNLFDIFPEFTREADLKVWVL